MEYQQIIYQPGTVARVILDRPQYYNAQSYVLLEEMDDAFARAVADDAVRVIVLSGNGEHFSSGHDLGTPESRADRERRGLPTTLREQYKQLRAFNVENTLRWRNLPKPTIAMVHGYCIFGGWMIASAMDVIFASTDAKFLAGPVEYFCIPWDVDPRKAKEILFESRFLSAQEAFEHHFVNRVVPREKLEEETLAYARRVAENDPFLVETSKFLVNNALDTMGFTASVEAAFQSYFGAIHPRLTEEAQNRRLAPVDLALRHLRET
jgi:enoyl-CoA hydratase